MRTIKSVQTQDTQFSFEHVIVDGASTDNSLNIARRYQRVAENVIIKSEKDSGIYNAMNKGLALVSGSYVAFLNSGDILAHNGVINDICAALNQNQSIDLLYGDLCFVDDNDLVTREWISGAFSKCKLFLGWMPPHPMTTIRNSILSENKGFNESLKIAADYDLMLRILLLRDVVVEYLPAIFVRMELGGISNGSLASIIKSNIEVIKSWRNNAGHIAPYWVFFIKPLYKITQLRRRKLK